MIQKQSVKAMTSSTRNVPYLGVLLFASIILGIACQKEQLEHIHPTARKAIESFRGTDLSSLWTKVSPFSTSVTNEIRLVRLAFQEDTVFAVFADGRSVDGRIASGKLEVTQVFHQYADGKLVITQPGRQTTNGNVVSTNVCPSLSQTDGNHILEWVERCKDNGVYGFDLRYLPESYRVALRNDSYCDVYLLVLTDKATARFRDECNLQSKRGFTSRSDAFERVTNGVFIVTEHR